MTGKGLFRRWMTQRAEGAGYRPQHARKPGGAGSPRDGVAAPRAAAAVCRGLAHERDGGPCQDSAAAGVSQGVATACVSDGLGSLALSQVGSAAVARAVPGLARTPGEFERLCALADADLRALIASRLRGAVLSEAAARAADMSADPERTAREMRCTAVGVIACSGRYLAFKQGDGAAFAVSPDGFERLFRVDDVEDEARTRTVLDPDAAECLEIERGELSAGGPSGLLVTTDGLRLCGYFPSSTVVPEELRRLYNACAAAAPGLEGGALQTGLDALRPDSVGDDLGCAVVACSADGVPVTRDDFRWTCACGERHEYSEYQCPACGRGFEDTYGMAVADKIGATASVNACFDALDDFVVRRALERRADLGYPSDLGAVLAAWSECAAYGEAASAEAARGSGAPSPAPGSCIDAEALDAMRDLLARRIGKRGIVGAEAGSGACASALARRLVTIYCLRAYRDLHA